MSIELSQKSQEYMEEVFSRYKEIQPPDSWTFNICENKEKWILHIYPTEDTDGKNGLSGFVDALFFDIHFYNIEQKTKFIIRSKDQIELHVFADIRIFKDNSTMIIIRKPSEVVIFQSMEINGL